jgi:hypothetical protein
MGNHFAIEQMQDQRRANSKCYHVGTCSNSTDNITAATAATDNTTSITSDNTTSITTTTTATITFAITRHLERIAITRSRGDGNKC